MRTRKTEPTPTLLAWDDARSCVLARTPVLPRERVRLEEATGRILAEPVVARDDWPPFSASAVDGYAVRSRDVEAATPSRPVRLRVLGSIRAGQPPTGRLRSGTAMKIMTGAGVPTGATAVVMKEHCRESADGVEVSRPARRGENIRPRGGAFRAGQQVLPSGVPVTPPVAGLLAVCGYARVYVHARPVVSVAVTGDELLAPSRRLTPGKIRDANTYSLSAALRALGLEPGLTLRLKDRPGMIRRHLSDALERSDVLLVSGGVSVGDHDHVRPALAECGVREQFWRVAVKPGKPAFFGLFKPPAARKAAGGGRRPGLVFGLPGNPVSALVCFHQLVKPALRKMMGWTGPESATLPARLKGSRRKPPGRLEWLRGILSVEKGELWVTPAPGQDSHMLGGLAGADCLIRFPAASGALAHGETVSVELLSWNA